MRGHKRAAQLALEERVLIESLAAQMRVQAGAGKLAPLEDYLKKVRPRAKRTVKDMILALQDAAARGAPIKITKVEG